MSTNRPTYKMMQRYIMLNSTVEDVTIKTAYGRRKITINQSECKTLIGAIPFTHVEADNRAHHATIIGIEKICYLNAVLWVHFDNEKDISRCNRENYHVLDENDKPINDFLYEWYLSFKPKLQFNPTYTFTYKTMRELLQKYNVSRQISMPSRTGSPIELTIDTHPFQITPFARVNTPRGLATCVGMTSPWFAQNKVLWFLLDEDMKRNKGISNWADVTNNAAATAKGITLSSTDETTPINDFLYQYIYRYFNLIIPARFQYNYQLNPTQAEALLGLDLRTWFYVHFSLSFWAKPSIIGDLPNEIVLKIASYLTPETISIQDLQQLYYHYANIKLSEHDLLIKHALGKKRRHLEGVNAELDQSISTLQKTQSTLAWLQGKMTKEKKLATLNTIFCLKNERLKIVKQLYTIGSLFSVRGRELVEKIGQLKSEQNPACQDLE